MHRQKEARCRREVAAGSASRWVREDNPSLTHVRGGHGQTTSRNMFLQIKTDDSIFERVSVVRLATIAPARLAWSRQDDLIRLNAKIAPYSRMAD